MVIAENLEPFFCLLPTDFIVVASVLSYHHPGLHDYSQHLGELQEFGISFIKSSLGTLGFIYIII